MTIDEAISSMKYDGELMKELEEERIGHEVEYTSDEYKQFADWLEELKVYKELGTIEELNEMLNDMMV